MGRIRVDDPAIDVAALEAKVEARIASRRGVRFSDAEIEELRASHLQPRLRRADLPRGIARALDEVQGELPAVPPPPAPEAVSFGQTRDADLDRSRPPGKGLVAALYGAQRGGVRGRLVAAMRRLMRPFYKATLNLEHVVGELESRIDGLGERDDRYLDYVETRLERSLDLLKDDADRHVDRSADWAGRYLSRQAGLLDSRRARTLHLLHNLVYELTDARLQLETMEDRLHESMRRVARLEERQRSLEKLTLGPPAEPPPACSQ